MIRTYLLTPFISFDKDTVFEVFQIADFMQCDQIREDAKTFIKLTINEDSFIKTWSYPGLEFKDACLDYLVTLKNPESMIKKYLEIEILSNLVSLRLQ